MPRYPVFCTTQIPAEALNQLCQLRSQFSGQFGSEDFDLFFVTPLHQVTELLKMNTDHGLPVQDLTAIAPFPDWTLQECYSFYKTHLQDRPEKLSNFTTFTFLILDRDTLTHRKKHGCYTTLVCTDVPDVSDIPKHQHQEGQHRPILKTRRLAFAAAVQTIDTWEMMTGMPSDLGQKEQLSFHAESWFEHVEYTDYGSEIKRFVSPETARAKQEKLLREYVDGERDVDVSSAS